MKRINSKQKGNRGEAEFAKILSTTFGMPFARVGASSGARTKNTVLPENAIEVMNGDIITPPNFRFSIEVKTVNQIIDWTESSALLDGFLEQAKAEATAEKNCLCLLGSVIVSRG